MLVMVAIVHVVMVMVMMVVMDLRASVCAAVYLLIPHLALEARL